MFRHLSPLIGSPPFLCVSYGLLSFLALFPSFYFFALATFVLSFLPLFATIILWCFCSAILSALCVFLPFSLCFWPISYFLRLLSGCCAGLLFVFLSLFFTLHPSSCTARFQYAPVCLGSCFASVLPSFASLNVVLFLLFTLLVDGYIVTLLFCLSSMFPRHSLYPCVAAWLPCRGCLALRCLFAPILILLFSRVTGASFPVSLFFRPFPASPVVSLSFMSLAALLYSDFFLISITFTTLCPALFSFPACLLLPLFLSGVCVFLWGACGRSLAALVVFAVRFACSVDCLTVAGLACRMLVSCRWLGWLPWLSGLRFFIVPLPLTFLGLSASVDSASGILWALFRLLLYSDLLSRFLGVRSLLSAGAELTRLLGGRRGSSSCLFQVVLSDC